MKDLSRRDAVGLGLATGALALTPARLLADQRIVMNEASQLNPTPVARHVVRTESAQDGLIAAIRMELKDAAKAGRPVAIGAARHSMGGQSLPRDGTAITFESPWFNVDTANSGYRVYAGAPWGEW